MDDFGKKAKEGILGGFEFLKGKAKEKIDLQKLSSQSRALEQRRNECLLEVGNRVFVFFEMDRVQTLEESDWESIRPHIDEVKDINRKLQEVEEHVQAVKSGHPEALHQEAGHSDDAPPT